MVPQMPALGNTRQTAASFLRQLLGSFVAEVVRVIAWTKAFYGPFQVAGHHSLSRNQCERLPVLAILSGSTENLFFFLRILNCE